MARSNLPTRDLEVATVYSPEVQTKKELMLISSLYGHMWASRAQSQSHGDIWLVQRVGLQFSFCPPGQNSGIRNIADLQKLAVAEWLQSYNSVRGPLEWLGIMW